MPLNDLSLEQLTKLADDLKSLAKVGQSLAPLNPIFDLTPGQPTRITLDPVMPDVAKSSPVQEFLANRGEYLARKQAERFIQPPSIEAAQPEPAPEPVDAPSTAGEGVEGAPISAEPSRSDDDPAPPPAGAEATPPPLVEAASDEGKAESGGGSEVAAPAPAAPVPGSASALAASAAKYAPWTDDEDHRLVALVVSGVVGLGLTKTAAINAAAREMGRPETGTVWRCKNKLATRLDSAIAEAVAAKADAEALLTPSPEAARQDAPQPQADVQGESAEPPVGDAPALVPEPGAGAPTHVANPILAHIMTLPTKGGWTLERDLELMELSIQGWQPNEIALQLQIQASLIRPRFDLLTGLYEDANDKKVRRFRREDVFEALKSLTAGKAA